MNKDELMLHKMENYENEDDDAYGLGHLFRDAKD